MEADDKMLVQVYIGFGSIVVEDPNATTELIFDAVRKSGQVCTPAFSLYAFLLS